MSRSGARLGAIVQARMSSSRLPGKVLAELGGRPALLLLLSRLSRASEPDLVAVATSVEPEDDAVAAACEQAGVPVARGPLDDVLERYRAAADELECDGVVRITGDCPLIDPEVVDAVAARWRAGGADYVANVIEPRTFPKGQDTEVVSATALLAAAAEAERPYDREHVTPFVRERPERFSQVSVIREPAAADVRMVLDTVDDLEVLRRLVAAAGPEAGLDELCSAYDAEGLRKIQ